MAMAVAMAVAVVRSTAASEVVLSWFVPSMPLPTMVLARLAMHRSELELTPSTGG